MVLVVDIHRPAVGVHSTRKVTGEGSHKLVEVQDSHGEVGSMKHMDAAVACHMRARSMPGNCRSRCGAHKVHLVAGDLRIWSADLHPSWGRSASLCSHSSFSSLAGLC